MIISTHGQCHRPPLVKLKMLIGQPPQERSLVFQDAGPWCLYPIFQSHDTPLSISIIFQFFELLDQLHKLFLIASQTCFLCFSKVCSYCKIVYAHLPLWVLWDFQNQTPSERNIISLDTICHEAFEIDAKDILFFFMKLIMLNQSKQCKSESSNCMLHKQ